ncbi:MAG: helix-turn-helix domain-containing protein [Eubacteriales bacterium]|nr:helix-turn-helix domain-containing protein [Eubacteriales bacterium]MDD3881933.1 helix-turn-helix domain-containing protein [Eubacteriales bacterium]MDD4513826.1 helix-turn-helix domain-containing protein [Eubacteriales bacterium]
MPELEKLYTVEEIAKMTSLTTRTIRNHLRSGILMGRKIGGQWRFTEKDIERFMESGEASKDMANEQKQAVLDFIDGVNTDVRGTLQICSIIDLYAPADEAKRKSDLLCEAINASQGESYLQYKFDYAESEGKARFILFASPEIIKQAMEIVK